MNGIWEEVKQQLRSEIPEQSFSLWIKPITFLERREDTVVIGCPNKFSKNWVMENYAGLLQRKLAEVGGSTLQVSLEVKHSSPSPPVPRVVKESRQLAFPNMKRRGVMTARWMKNNLTFDRFVVGKCNEFAYSVSRSVSSGSEMVYNPLLMLSNTGLGKSHLAQAIGHDILSRDPETRVCYITSEDFVNEMIFSLKTNQIEAFKSKYRRCCDVLLLEEVHFLSGKNKTQKELEYTLDTLANDRKRIIFTSAVLPKDIPNLSKGMESRLTSGIITTMNRPDYETRVKLLERKASETGLALSEEAVHLLAKHLSRDVRQIESALSCLKAKTELLKEKISKGLIMEVNKCLVSEIAGRSLEDIMGMVCRYFSLEQETLASRSRKKAHAYPRNLFSYLCRKHTDATLEEIGRSINRNHSTVLYASEVIASKVKVDRSIRKQVDFFSQRIEKGPA
ncbi:MAG: chromosomal replication initiator protein DnaA [Deltaproteobacteria bacterium]|nr:chromosomal replication initiator protein DnaA [Deltaproteobacteria bacterium]